MDQAQALVLALNPLLDQVLEKLQQAIDALIGLLAQLQKGIETAKSALDAILDTVLGSVRMIREQLDGLLDSVHEQAQAYLEKIQLQPLIDDLLDKLDEIAASIFDPIDEKIHESSGSISTFVKDSKSIVSDAVTSLRSELDKLIALLDEADEAGQSQVGELDVLFEKIQGAWSDLESKTNLQIDNTSAYMDQLIDQTLSDSANQMGIQWPAQT
jgi:vacuolar-type H+-ATPase subunit I/STV1